MFSVAKPTLKPANQDPITTFFGRYGIVMLLPKQNANVFCQIKWVVKTRP